MDQAQNLFTGVFTRLRGFLGWERPRLSMPRRIWRLCLLLLFLLVLDIGRYLIWPPVWRLAEHNPTSTAFMDLRREERTDAGKTGKLAYNWVNWRQISPNLKLAVTIAEDDAFWDHYGFSVDGLEDALLTNVRKGRFKAGGSTITQQLAKNIYLSPARSITRKLKEAILAMRLELHLDKRRILELYLNVAEWGDGIFGAEAAARHYFGVSAASLTQRQAAILAAMLPNPHRLQPGSRAVMRKADILQGRMARRGLH